MKRVVVKAKMLAEVEAAAMPRAKDNWVLVKSQVVPMCTEYKAFAAGVNHRAFGHEAAGEVVEVAQPGRVKVGDRVVAMPMSSCGVCPLCLDGDFIYCQNHCRLRRAAWQLGRTWHDGAIPCSSKIGCLCRSLME